MAVNQEIVAQMQQIKFNLFKEQSRETGRFDVIFEVEGKKLYAHKTMLNLISDTFDAMLSDRWMKNKEIPIKIESYGYENFYQFLTFLYSGDCQLTDTNIFSMVDIAEFYGVQIFKDYCEKYLSKTEFTMDNIFSFLEMSEKYSMIQLKASVQKFIAKNFHRFAGCESFMKLEKSVVEELIAALKDEVKPENLFQAVYKWSEKRALHQRATNPNMKINTTIKTEISDFLLHIQFEKMDLHFLHEFVVKIINAHGQTIHGNIINDKIYIDLIKSLNGPSGTVSFGVVCWWNVPCQKISNPSPLKKKEGIKWYLTYSVSIFDTGNGYVSLKHSSLFDENDYLLAEIIPGTSGFELTDALKIEMD